MKRDKKKIPWIKVLRAAVVTATLGAVFYCMANHLGLADGLDFGAGAYYYADIPEFTKYVNVDAYQSGTPMWVLVALFLAWGGIMYRLWTWLEKNGNQKQEDVGNGKIGAENEI